MTGLSLGTISKALNGKTGVSNANREKVQQAVSELGFQRWPIMNSSISPPESITVIAYGFAAQSDTYYEKILRTLIEEGKRYALAIDVNLVIQPHSVREIPEDVLFRNGIPAALILIGIDDPSTLDKIAAIGCPTVLVNGIDPLMRFDSICPDYFLGGYLATRRLLDQGHRNIVHIGTGRRLTLDLRRQGFIAALNQAGIAYDPERHMVDIGTQHFPELNEQLLTEALICDGKPKGTAFFAVADTVALSAIHVLNNSGFSVPGDVSVIGFDDLSVSAHCTPPLTTMHSKRTAVAKMAIPMLLERAANPHKDICRISIGIGLVERESTAYRV